MSFNNNQPKFSIHGRTKKGAYFMFFLAIISLPGQFVFAYYKGYLGDIDFWGIGPFILVTAAAIGSGYAGYYFYVIKTLEIDERGVRYIFNKKIKKELIWNNVSEVLTRMKEKNFYLIVSGSGKYITFSTAVIRASKEDLQKAFYELLRYQSQYNFVVDDELGWSKNMVHKY